MVGSSSCGATHLMVLAKASLIGRISSTETGSVTTGFGNIIKNKGGVAVCFNLGSTSLAFVNAHFQGIIYLLFNDNFSGTRKCRLKKRRFS